MLLSTKRLLPPLLSSASQHRCYASSESTTSPYTDWPTSQPPTPYEVLSHHPPHKLYSKHRYIELCRLYHPDTSHHHPASRQHASSYPKRAVRLERFRLAVAAHTILSDPVKRAAYDRWGAGWAGAPPVHHRWRPSPAGPPTGWWGQREGHGDPGPFAHAYGRGGPNDASQNATWEDWERWYNARAGGGRQEEVFADNRVFLAVVVLLACAGSVAEVKYASRIGEERIEESYRQSLDIGRDLNRRRRAALESNDREGRMRRFLLMRDPGSGNDVWEKVMGSGPKREVAVAEAPE